MSLLSAHELFAADGSEPSAESLGKADLISEMAAIAPGDPFTLALRITLPEGWHTYWRNPGDAGAPTHVRWQLPPGFTAGELKWPAPERFTSGPIVSFGYQDETWLLTTITPPAELPAGQIAAIAAEVDWLICAKVCVPQHAALSITLPVAAAPTPSQGPGDERLARARLAMPVPPPWPIAAKAEAAQIVLRLNLPQQPAPRFSEAIFFPADRDVIDIAADQPFALRGGDALLTLPLAASQSPPATLIGVLVLSDGRQRHSYDLALDVAR